MPLTLDEVIRLEQNLRQEIAAKQRLLGVYEFFRAEMGGGGIFPPAATTAIATAARPTLPAVQEPPRYVNPDLEEWKQYHRGTTGLVRWAVLRMTHDYCGRDIVELLSNERESATSAEVSVVLTRLKGQGEIVEITPGNGRIGAIFRAPSNPLPVRREEPVATENGEPLVAPAEIS